MLSYDSFHLLPIGYAKIGPRSAHDGVFYEGDDGIAKVFGVEWFEDGFELLFLDSLMIGTPTGSKSILA